METSLVEMIERARQQVGHGFFAAHDRAALVAVLEELKGSVDPFKALKKRPALLQDLLPLLSKEDREELWQRLVRSATGRWQERFVQMDKSWNLKVESKCTE